MLLAPGRLWGALGGRAAAPVLLRRGLSCFFYRRCTAPASPLSSGCLHRLLLRCVRLHGAPGLALKSPRGRLLAEYSCSASRNAPGWRNSPADEAAHGRSPAAPCASPAPSAPAVPAGVDRPIHPAAPSAAVNLLALK
ncbi:hypothetical protein NDU88_004403 [Pleurodeles waltl]|uniref:Uncharacterized protein n=1 Tax=Pleurodeles waltl TaxID=8319 RepID=A0AAV7WY57_PLEWA|nr:hypothetical protein NDU88_004403 [Pleurodeles waltl]